MSVHEIIAANRPAGWKICGFQGVSLCPEKKGDRQYLQPFSRVCWDPHRGLDGVRSGVAH